MSHPPLLPLLLLLQPLLPMARLLAQVWPTALAGPVNVRAGATAAAGVTPGSDVWPGFVRGCTSGVGTAQLQVSHFLWSTRVEAQWSLSCQANANGTAASEACIRYELWSAAPIAGQLTVSWSNAKTGSGNATLSVDVFDDGMVDATGSMVMPVTFGPSGLPFRISASCLASAGIVYGPFGSSWSYSGTAQASLSVCFEPTPWPAQQVGVGCGGPVPALTQSANLALGVDVAATFAGEVDIALLVLGLGTAQVPLPWPPVCTLWVDPVVVDWQVLDAQHGAWWGIAVPPAVRPVSLFAQMLGLDVTPFVVTATPALRIDCN